MNTAEAHTAIYKACKAKGFPVDNPELWGVQFITRGDNNEVEDVVLSFDQTSASGPFAEILAAIDDCEGPVSLRDICEERGLLLPDKPEN